MKFDTTQKFGAALLISVALAGCSAASGPTFSAYSINLPNDQKAFQVSCEGLFSSQDTCYSKAREICGKNPMRPTQEIAPLAAAGSHRDARTLTFQCGTAPVAQTAPLTAPTPVAAPTAVTQVPAPARTPPQKLSLSADANFELDKATLTTDARLRLDALIKTAAGTTFDTVTVNGYTDATASNAYNQKLSTQRAQSVAQYLQSRGLKSRQFVVNGYGSAHPVAPNTSASGRAKNRRVEIDLN
ncbi:OmpA family protein [Paraburkholderia sprentiae WSM5005]|uniref:OmpA family protein n=1 Tax=Paraburkholderia sprentiae WSM5005 TaxID=754502 RepID=A0A1I9YMA3_9BURK|nr:OmpA family protein [Paraburkholderia sprentiae]APA87436.1 OmpA family protein [Paraburkholderia sprentiae WSM5005]